MTNDNIVPMPNAMQVAPVIIDDSRLQTLWGQQHRRQNWIVWGCCATALLIASALVIMAFRINSEPPKVEVAAPKVEVAAPVINIPAQPAPVVNITNPPPTINVQTPAAPAPTVTPPPSMTPRTGESKVVTEYTQFTTVTVGQFEVHSGWAYRSSKDSAPTTQYCYSLIGRTGKLSLAVEGVTSPTLATDARNVGVDPAQAETLVKSCRWFTAELRDPTR